jgi:hypothetical protein
MKQFLTIIALLFVYSLSAQKNNLLQAPQLKVNWEDFLSRHDMVWDTMPGDYFEAPFVGNGLLGTIFFKDNSLPNTLRFEIGRTDVYDHRSKDLPIAHY